MAHAKTLRNVLETLIQYEITTIEKETETFMRKVGRWIYPQKRHLNKCLKLPSFLGSNTIA